MFAAYDAFYNRVAATDPTYKKRKLFWCHLVGHMQRYLPANVAQIFVDPGLYNAVENSSKNSRRFDFKDNQSSFFPLSFGSNSGLGYNVAAGFQSLSSVLFPRVLPPVRPQLSSRFQNLCQATTVSFQNLLRNQCELTPEV